MFEIAPVESLYFRSLDNSLLKLIYFRALLDCPLILLVNQNYIVTKSHAKLVHRDLFIQCELIKCHLYQIVYTRFAFHLVCPKQHLESV